MIAGTCVSPAMVAALHRLSPAIISYPEDEFRTTIGCINPAVLIESASDRSESSSNTCLGCRGLGVTLSTGS